MHSDPITPSPIPVNLTNWPSGSMLERGLSSRSLSSRPNQLRFVARSPKILTFLGGEAAEWRLKLLDRLRPESACGWSAGDLDWRRGHNEVTDLPGRVDADFGR